MSKSTTLWVVLGLVIPFSSGAQTIIHGRVTDKDSKMPVAGVTVLPDPYANRRAITDMDGTFSVTIDSTTKTVIFSQVGYKKLRVPVTSGGLNVELEEDPNPLDFLEAYNKFTQDTIVMPSGSFTPSVAVRLKGVELELPADEFVKFLDSIVTVRAIADYRRSDFAYGIKFIQAASKKSKSVHLTRTFIKRVGITVIERFSVGMIEKGRVRVWDKKGTSYQSIIREKAGYGGRPECPSCCWYGRRYYLPGTKEFFLSITDVIC